MKIKDRAYSSSMWSSQGCQQHPASIPRRVGAAGARVPALPGLQGQQHQSCAAEGAEDAPFVSEPDCRSSVPAYSK